jgi:hypothetical protein
MPNRTIRRIADAVADRDRKAVLDGGRGVLEEIGLRTAEEHTDIRRGLCPGVGGARISPAPASDRFFRTISLEPISISCLHVSMEQRNQRREGRMEWSAILKVVLFVAGYLLLTSVVLPRLGVPT